MEIRELDFAKVDKGYYKARQKPEIRIFGDIRYITIEGKGEPGGANYQSHIQSLFSLVNTLKNQLLEEGNDFVIPNLECLWWVDEGATFENTPRDQWNWRLMIRIPLFISRDEIEDAKFESLDKRGGSDIQRVSTQLIAEGRCVQALHKGPYERIGDTYGRILAFMKGRGLTQNGYFHEIYLNNPGRTSKEKLQTIVRLPVK